MGGIAILIVSGLCLLSIFPADSLLSRTLGPALLQALGAPGGVLFVAGRARARVEEKAGDIREKRTAPSGTKPIIEINTGVDDGPSDPKILRFPKRPLATPTPAGGVKPPITLQQSDDEEPAIPT